MGRPRPTGANSDQSSLKACIFRHSLLLPFLDCFFVSWGGKKSCKGFFILISCLFPSFTVVRKKSLRYLPFITGEHRKNKIWKKKKSKNFAKIFALYNRRASERFRKNLNFFSRKTSLRYLSFITGEHPKNKILKFEERKNRQDICPLWQEEI